METKLFIETLKKFNREPSLCTLSEVSAVQKFYRNLDKTLKVYEEVTGYDPFGHTIESKLTEIKYYLDRLNEERVNETASVNETDTTH